MQRAGAGRGLGGRLTFGFSGDLGKGPKVKRSKPISPLLGLLYMEPGNGSMGSGDFKVVLLLLFSVYTS